MKSQSPRQYGTLRYFEDGARAVKVLRGINQITLWSLLHRGYLEQFRAREDGYMNEFVRLSENGKAALAEYSYAKLSERLKQDDLTERVARLLVKASIRSRSGRKVA